MGLSDCRKWKWNRNDNFTLEKSHEKKGKKNSIKELFSVSEYLRLKLLKNKCLSKLVFIVLISFKSTDNKINYHHQGTSTKISMKSQHLNEKCLHFRVSRAIYKIILHFSMLRRDDDVEEKVFVTYDRNCIFRFHCFLQRRQFSSSDMCIIFYLKNNKFLVCNSISCLRLWACL